MSLRPARRTSIGMDLCLGLESFVDLFDELFDAARLDVARELCLDDAGVNCGGAHASRAVAPVELHGEKNVGGFGTAVGDERVVGRAFETGIVEVDVGIAMPGGRKIDE